MNLRDEECPHCGAVEALFLCSFGGVNCAECGQFVRIGTKEELKASSKKFEKLRELLKKKEDKCMTTKK